MEGSESCPLSALRIRVKDNASLVQYVGRDVSRGQCMSVEMRAKTICRERRK